MRITRGPEAGWLSNRSWIPWALVLVLLSGLPACSINVKKDGSGQDNKVDINTPFGGIHVNKSADARDTGLPVYPGARIREKAGEGQDQSANVDISGMGYGLKVVAVDYESGATPSVLIAYYKTALKKYGDVLECHTNDVNYERDSKNMSNELSCGPDTGSNIELKAGSRDNQRIVAIKPADKGSEFTLVYVETHGKDTI
jgi:hypothetical protein